MSVTDRRHHGQNQGPFSRGGVRLVPFGKGLLLDRDPFLLFSKRHSRQALVMRRLNGSEGIGGGGSGGRAESVLLGDALLAS